MIRSCYQYLFLWRAGIPENAYCAIICHYLVLLNNNNLYLVWRLMLLVASSITLKLSKCCIGL